MTLKGEDEGMKNVTPLFAQRGYVGADGAEGLGAGDGTETAGGFLLELGHTDIALCLVVVEGHTRVSEKTQDIVGVQAQTQQKIDRGGLLDAATGLVGASAARIVAFAFDEDGFVLAAQSAELWFRQGMFGQPGGIGTVLGPTQEVDHRLRPSLFGGFRQVDEFAQMMGIAQPMGAVIFAIRSPAVMHGNAFEYRQDAKSVHRDLATLVVRAIPGQQGRARRVQPAQPRAHSLSGLIEVHHRRGTHRRRDPLDRRGQRLRGLRNA